MQSSSVGPTPILPPPADPRSLLSTFGSCIGHELAELQKPSSAEAPTSGNAEPGDKKKGTWRFSCNDLRLGNADTPIFIGNRAKASTEEIEGRGGARSELGLKLVAAAEAAAAAMVEKQDTCSLAIEQSYEQLSWSVRVAEEAARLEDW